MRLGWVFVGVTVLAALISGCLGGEEGATERSTEPGFGLIFGHVYDDEGFPVAGATVILRSTAFGRLQLNTSTDDDGAYRVERVPPGTLALTAEKDGFSPDQTQVTIDAGATLERNFTLVVIPGITPRAAPQATLTGRFDCVASWGIDGGSCDALVPSPGPRPFNASSQHDFSIPEGWDGLLLELSWQASGPTNVYDGVRFDVFDANGTRRYASAEGAAGSLRIAVDRGTPHAGADDNLTIPTSGAAMVLKVRPIGVGRDPSCIAQCTQGVALVPGITYNIYPTLFFGTGVRPGYTALA